MKLEYILMTSVFHEFQQMYLDCPVSWISPRGIPCQDIIELLWIGKLLYDSYVLYADQIIWRQGRKDQSDVPLKIKSQSKGNQSFFNPDTHMIQNLTKS